MEEEFITHGVYTVSNVGGYEIQISDCGNNAKVRDAYGSHNPVTSDWIEISFIEGDLDNDFELRAVIDPNGYNIPLDQVIKI